MTAVEVLNNVDAMRWAVDSVAAEDAITPAHVLEIHQRLLVGTRLERFAGVVRREQNWIGGSSYSPCSATFVPPPAAYVDDLLVDLCEFCSGDALPAVAQAAIAHAQFRDVHPFIDGNGRRGRALIHVILKRRGLVRAALPPVSLVLATWSVDYVAGLTATRYSCESGDDAAIAGINRWIALFAAAVTRAVEDARTYELGVREVQARCWAEDLADLRTDEPEDPWAR